VGGGHTAELVAAACPLPAFAWPFPPAAALDAAAP